MINHLKEELPSGQIDSKIMLEKFLMVEAKKYNRKNTRNPLILVRESDFLWRHNLLLRKSEYYVNTNKKIRGLLFRILLKRFQNKFMIRIPLNSFGCGLKIMHLGPVFVNGKCKCGRNISLHVNASLVAGGINDGIPTLDDGVVVGIGAVILGDIRIAKNIAIGANAVVNRTFDEENIAIAGVPAKKISNNGRLEWGKNK